MRWGYLFSVAALAACHSQPVSEEQQRMAARRLLEPFLEERTVLCAELDVTITSNFIPHVGNPGVDKQRHRFERTEDGDVVTKVWTNPTGLQDSMFRVTIGEKADPVDVEAKPRRQTTFLVLNQFRLHVRERGEWTVAARTTGAMAVTEASATHKVREFSVVDGVVTRR